MAIGPGFLRSLPQRLAQPFVNLAVRLTRTAAQLGRALTRAGVTVEAALLRRQMAVERTVVEAGKRITGLPEGVIFDPANIPEAVSRQRREFAFTVRTTFINVATGAQESRFVTVSTDRLLTTEEILTEAQELNEDYGTEIQILSTEITRATKVGAAGLL